MPKESFILQYSLLDAGSDIIRDWQFYAPLFNGFDRSDENTSRIIQPLNLWKAHSWDEISIRMIIISDYSLATAPKLFFKCEYCTVLFLKFGKELM